MESPVSELGEIGGEYHLMSELGRGSHGVVWKARDLKQQRIRAVKILEFKEEDTEVSRSRILREVSIHKSVFHPNVLEFVDLQIFHVSTGVNVWMIYELLDMDLAQLIYSSRQISNETVSFIADQVLEGLQFLSSMGIVHRDIKPANILLNNSVNVVKICDFGLAVRLDQVSSEVDTPSSYAATRWYRPPELLLASVKWSFAGRLTPFGFILVDMWSFGCTLAELIRKKPLFPGRDTFDQLRLLITTLGHPSAAFISEYVHDDAAKFIASIPRGIPQPLKLILPYGIPPSLVHIIQSSLCYDPESRITAANASTMLKSSNVLANHPKSPSRAQTPTISISEHKFESFITTIQSPSNTSSHLNPIDTTPRRIITDPLAYPSPRSSPWDTESWTTNIASASVLSPASLEYSDTEDIELS